VRPEWREAANPVEARLDQLTGEVVELKSLLEKLLSLVSTVVESEVTQPESTQLRAHSIPDESKKPKKRA